MDVKQKKRWDVDDCESFLGKKGRTNTGCCLAAVNAKDSVLTQAVDLVAAEHKGDPAAGLERKPFPPK